MATMRQLFTTILFLSFVGGGVPALYAQLLENPDLEEATREIVANIYNFQHRKADMDLYDLSLQYPEDPIVPFLEALNLYWQVNISRGHHALIQKIDPKLGEVHARNEAFKDQAAYQRSYHFVAFLAYGLEARLRYFEESDLRAANAARKIFPHLRAALNLADNSPELSLIAGLYHYYAVVYPRDRAYLRAFASLFPDGDVDQGLAELRYAASIENLGRPQALYYLTDIYLNEFEQPANALATARRLVNLYPRNTWFEADYIQTLIASRRFAEAKSRAEEVREVYERQSGYQTRAINGDDSPYTTQVMMRVYHYLGQVAYHEAGNYSQAKSWFQKSLQAGSLADMERDNFRASAIYYLGRCEDALGNRDAAISAYRAALDHPDNATVESSAEAFLRSPCTNHQTFP